MSEKKKKDYRLVVDESVYCIMDRTIVKEPDVNCPHVWKHIEDEDTWGGWKCDKCGGHIRIGVWD